MRARARRPRRRRAERRTRLLERARDLSRVVEVRLALCKRSRPRPGFSAACSISSLWNGQHVDALQALLLAGLERGESRAGAPAAPDISGGSARAARRIACVAVQIVDVMRLVEQLLTVVLAVNVDQIRRQLPQCRGRTSRLHVDAAGALAVRGDLPLDVQRVRLRHRQERKLVEQARAERRRQLGEHRADKALLRTRAHQIAADALCRGARRSSR